MCQDEYYRSNNCKILIKPSSDNKSCLHCHSLNQQIISEQNRKVAVLNEPAKLNASVKITSPERLKLTLQDHCLICKQLEEELSKMRFAIGKHSETVDSELSNDFKQLFSGCDKATVPNFLKLFWDEQQKYIQASCSSSVKYHPMFIKYCLNLAAKSSSAYSDLRYDSKTGNGILVLPSLRTLRDYIHPNRGFNPAVINNLAKKLQIFAEPE